MNQFNPYVVADNDFTVTFVKQDGSIRTLEGNLFNPVDRTSMTESQKVDYYKKVDESHMVRVYTSEGWKAFIKSNLMNLQIMETV